MTSGPHTVRLAPVAGSPAVVFEAVVVSPAGVRHGLLVADRPRPDLGDRPGPGFVDEHLAADLTEPAGFRRRRYADVLHLGPFPGADLHARLAGVLTAHPGCALATAEDRTGAVLLLARTGARLVLRACAPPGGPVPPPALGSLAHAWLAAGRRLTELTRVDLTGYRTPEPGRPRLRTAARRGGG
ncbi:hypothetical protein [Streptomyces sp. CBMA123]|uniref:hypothetical protein n=1 Tax=Streptomyces sp. CBMA123 TaxID=1896313 RepID=UPI001661DCE0|nr:hypothetical protein [Streptomyces sp. CBMA123]MBD0691381.1 hypothetical protein [Streptomyces sp. CBMA123]